MLESVANLTPKLRWEGMGKGVALFRGGEAVFHDKECGDSGDMPRMQQRSMKPEI